LRHSSNVLSAHFSPDGKRIVTASSDHTARVWDAQSGQPLTEPLKHDAKVLSAQFSPDGKRIVTASWDNTARAWDAQSGRPLTGPMKHSSYVWSAQFSPDGKLIVTASRDGTARIWDAQSGQPVTEPMKHSDGVFFAEFSPDGKRIVTASNDHTSRVWDAQSGQPLTEPIEQSSAVWSALFSPDGQRIVTTSFDRTARVWDVCPSPVTYPAWFLQLAEVISGQVLNKQGLQEVTHLDRNETISQLRQTLNQQPDDDEWAHWGRWFLADPATRTISPFSTMTVPQYIENRIKEDTDASLAEAERLAAGNAELIERIARARSSLEQRIEQTNRLETLEREGFMLAKQGQWKEAAADLSKVLELAPKDYALYFPLAALLAQTGDLQGYRQQFARAAARFDATNDVRLTSAVIQACLFMPLSSVDLEDVGKLAQRALTNCPPDDGNLYVYQFAMGLADYRQGRFSSVAEWLQKSVAVDQSDEDAVQGWMVLAMAQSQLHQTNQARASFANGAAMEETVVAKQDSGASSGAWDNKILSRVLAQEAQELIAGQTMDADLTGRIEQARKVLLSKSQAEPSARAGRWKEAAEDYAMLMQARTNDDLLCYSLATLLAQTGDVEGYRRHCAQVLARFGRTQAPEIAGRLAKECLILPGSGVDLEAVGKLAEMAVTVGGTNASLAWYQFDKGLAEYRQERFASAAAWEQKVFASGTNEFCQAEACMVLAMSQGQLKRPEEARQALAHGTEIIDTKLPKLESGDIGEDWRNWIIAHALLREARELIERPDAPHN
jgi:WD40 repeat protein/Flp pilus assembly protein TadD